MRLTSTRTMPVRRWHKHNQNTPLRVGQTFWSLTTNDDDNFLQRQREGIIKIKKSYDGANTASFTRLS